MTSQINSMGTADSEGPAWNKFWMSLEDGTESVMSDGASRPGHSEMRSLVSPHGDRPPIERGESVMPGDSASHHVASPDVSAVGAAEPPVESVPFAFKFKAPGGRMHRIQVIADLGIAQLITDVADKLGSEIDSVGGLPSVEEGGKLGKSGFALSYLDNEGDSVSITTDYDLLESIKLARQSGRDKVDLFVHDPSQPALPATVDPQPVITPIVQPPSPPVSTARERRRRLEEDASEEEEEVAPKVRRKAQAMVAAAPQPQAAEQVIQGVPNELLLPGAIGFLAVVIIGVFAFSRSSSR